MNNKFHRYFINLTESLATLSTCDRLKVGSVIVDQNNFVVTTGYNGSLPSLPHCDEVGHYLIDNHCVRTIHAEQNAILQAAKRGTKIANCVIYCNYLPCLNCMKAILGADIKTIYFSKWPYNDSGAVSLIKQYQDLFKRDNGSTAIIARLEGSSGNLLEEWII